MNKRLFTLGLVSLLSLTSLASCGSDEVNATKKDGVLLTIDGKDITVSDVFGKIDNSIDGAKAYYEAVNEILVKAIVTRDDDLKLTIDSKMADFRQDAKDSAKTNSTTYEEELEKALKAKGFETEKELEEDYYYQEQKKQNEKDFYSDANYKELTEQFVAKYAPYHVKHILVKVDAASGAITDGKISSQDALQISNVITRLAGQTKETFGEIAANASEDGSKSNYGDLGIMSKKTSFVPEFKLNTYTYSAFFEKEEGSKEKAKDSLIPAGFEDANDKIAVDKTINGIPYSSALDLLKYKDQTKASNNTIVKDAVENNYPRNVIFNNYYNNHGLNLVYLDSDAPAGSYDEKRFVTLSELTGKTGILFDNGDKTAINDAKVLCDEQGRPILVSRAGTGSGDSGYEGIHFIVMERSPFVDVTGEKDGATYNKVVQYYNRTIPSTTTTDPIEKSFISFIKTDDRTQYDSRKTTIETALKDMDANISFQMYEKNLASASKLNIVVNKDVESKIESYISLTRDASDYSEETSFNSSWVNFLEQLVVQKEYRDNRTLSKVCIEKFLSNDAQAFENGGLCYAK